MHTSDIAINKPPELRCVGITFTTRTHVVDTAINIYRDLGIDLEITNNTISIAVPKTAGAFYMGLIERFTGRMAWNEWEKP